ncbi:FAD-binding oxidoreductase [Asaia krungthepensis]|uniref:nitric oxide dioxygenase n=1 Tax=Asaia krungthepensis NRIC 0535 TaxID=1307925 RepID=A0ABQ0Q6C9_9PROT|nr:FAD-binding oxidoreductase [Asaia krungthepensis]GBQ93478.1 flavohemoprotein [Asaia krungthepensis NRIC 0535]
MIRPLHPGTAAIVKATIPALEAHGLAITKTMYASLMQDPAIAAMFNQTDQANGRQPHALAAAVLAYARHIEHPEKLKAALDLIVERHVAVMVEADQYPVVGAALLGAIRTVLGDAATPAIMEAWGDAYRFLAEVLITREADVYAERAALEGGWRDWRSLRVEKRTRETDSVTSFWLVPADDKPVLMHKPGQFLTFRLDRDGLNTRRSYSISSAPDARGYRISVKRDPNGQVSRWFHDQLAVGDIVDVTPPAGNFTLEGKAEVPVLLVSAGIGITPFMSMLLAPRVSGNTHPLHLVHGDHDLGSMPFQSELVNLSATTSPLLIDLFESLPKSAASTERTHKGRISASWVRSRVTPETHVYVCGPRSFQRDLIHGLVEQGVNREQIHHEFFGSDEEVTSGRS